WDRRTFGPELVFFIGAVEPGTKDLLAATHSVNRQPARNVRLKDDLHRLAGQLYQDFEPLPLAVRANPQRYRAAAARFQQPARGIAQRIREIVERGGGGDAGRRFSACHAIEPVWRNRRRRPVTRLAPIYRHRSPSLRASAQFHLMARPSDAERRGIAYA